MTTLETERLRLRMFRSGDLEAYCSMCADTAVMRFVGEGKPLSRTDAWRHIAIFLGTWELRGYGMWAIDDRTTGEFVGRVGYFHPEGWPGVELGWSLARPFWGRGLATEAARASLEHGFKSFGLTHVISLIHPENQRSIAVAERLGQRLEGSTQVFGQLALKYGIRRASAEAVPFATL